MKTFKQYLNESVNDAGLFKAVFVCGIPGAGKSYTISQISSGRISPRIVNTDSFTEYFMKKTGHQEIWSKFGDRAKQLSKNQLYGYVNGMLPLFVDSTSSNIKNVTYRAGLLESLGYDVGMVYVHTDLELALLRNSKRERIVDDDFIKQVYQLSTENYEFYCSKFKPFYDVNNNDITLSNQTMTAAYKAVDGFFKSDVSNPIGRRCVEELHSLGKKYLTDVNDEHHVRSLIDRWYS